MTANTASFSVPLEVVAQASKAAAFDGLEIWERDVAAVGGAVERVRGVLETRNLSLSALQVLRDFEGAPTAQRAHKLAEAERLLELTRNVGADTLLLCANTEAGASKDRAEQVADLRRLGDMAAARNLRIAFEPLVWSRWINRYEVTLDCIEAVAHPAVGLALDCFHLFYQGSPVELVEQVPLQSCFLVQVCDARPMDLSALQIARHHRLLPGEGVWPVAELVRRLEARGYDGFYNIEVVNDGYKTEDPTEFAKRAFASFERLFDPSDARTGW